MLPRLSTPVSGSSDCRLLALRTARALGRVRHVAPRRQCGRHSSAATKEGCSRRRPDTPRLHGAQNLLEHLAHQLALPLEALQARAPPLHRRKACVDRLYRILRHVSLCQGTAPGWVW
eukprot:3174371-Prymnesium_polylepis.1